MILLLVGLSGFAFKPAPSRRGKLDGPSAVLPLLVTSRALCGPMGVAVGVFFAAKTHKTWTNIEMLGDIGGLGVCIGASIFIALVFAMASDKIIHTKQAQMAIPPGVVVAVSVGILWHWIPGSAIGAFLTICIGAVVEHWVVKKCAEQTVLVAEMEQRLGQLSPTNGNGLPTFLASSSQNTLADYPSNGRYSNKSPSNIRSPSSNGRSPKSLGWQEEKPLQAIQDAQAPREVWVRPAKRQKKFTMKGSNMLGDTWQQPHSVQSGNAHAIEDRRSRPQRTATADQLRALTNLVDVSPRPAQGPTIVSVSPPPSR